MPQSARRDALCMSFGVIQSGCWGSQFFASTGAGRPAGPPGIRRAASDRAAPRIRRPPCAHGDDLHMLHGADPWVSCTARSQTPMGCLRARAKCMHLSRLGEISGRRRSPAAPRAAGPRSPRARVAEVADGDEDRRAARARASGPRPPARGTDVKPCPRRPAPTTPACRRLRAAATPPPDVRTTILVAAVVRARARPLAPSTRPRSRRRRPSRALTSGVSRATGRYGVPLARAGRGGAGVAKLGRKSGFEGQFFNFTCLATPHRRVGAH